MPKTNVVIYKEIDDSVPLLEWLDSLAPKAREKCLVRVELLKERGYDLRRPHCDLLEQGIYELRASLNRVNYRILYCFEGKNVALLSCGCTKEKRVSKKIINKAIQYHNNYGENPKAHTYLGEL